MSAKYDLHPLCTLFPRMAGAELDSLVADIKANGQREPIIIHEGMILDGGNRYRACLEAGIAPQTMIFGGGNLVAYVLSANLHRRHMSPGQQAAIVASCQDWATAQPKGGDRKSDQSATLHFDSVADRAKASGASERTQKAADKVARADPELAVAVGHGEISLPKAVAQVEAKNAKAKPAEKPAKPDQPDELTKVREENVELREANAEQGATIKELLAENAIIEASDQLAAAMAECKKLRELVRVLEERNRGMQNEVNAAKRAAQMWQRKYEKAQRAA